MQRLKNYSQARKEDRGLTLTNYAIERLLYRLSISEYSEQFVLKGAQLFRIWTDQPYRPTRDLDLLRFGSPDISDLEEIFRDICKIKTYYDDGIIYLPETVKAQTIREENEHDGIRIKLEYRIGRTGQGMQIDIGFGDSVTPPASEIKFPSILEMPCHTLKAYQRETVIAEKVEAMVSLGFPNSRMKDFYDVYMLSEKFKFDGKVLQEAIQKTFERRNTSIPKNRPVALSEEFYGDEVKQVQWNAFIRKSNLEKMPFKDVIQRINNLVEPIFQSTIKSETFAFTWSSQKGWA